MRLTLTQAPVCAKITAVSVGFGGRVGGYGGVMKLKGNRKNAWRVPRKKRDRITRTWRDLRVVGQCTWFVFDERLIS